jgi:hypothetical protein
LSPDASRDLGSENGGIDCAPCDVMRTRVIGSVATARNACSSFALSFRRKYFLSANLVNEMFSAQVRQMSSLLIVR